MLFSDDPAIRKIGLESIAICVGLQAVGALENNAEKPAIIFKNYRRILKWKTSPVLAFYFFKMSAVLLEFCIVEYDRPIIVSTVLHKI